jgi:hypothetical protein
MNNELHLPPPIADFVKAVNEHESEDFLAVFAENAVITDEGHQYQGIAAIKDWDDEKNIGANITMNPVEITGRDGKMILTADMDGNFDKTGLPDPFLMDLHFTLEENLISALEYRLAGK